MSDYPDYPQGPIDYQAAADVFGIRKDAEGLQKLLDVDFDTAVGLEIAVMRVIVEDVPSPYEGWFAPEQFPGMTEEMRQKVCDYVDVTRRQGKYS